MEKKTTALSQIIYKFKEPYEFEGKQYEQIEIDLSGLKGADISAAKKAWSSEGNFAVLPTLDYDFCAQLLARVSKQPIEFYTEMCARDYCALTQQVSNFLMS